MVLHNNQSRTDNKQYNLCVWWETGDKEAGISSVVMDVAVKMAINCVEWTPMVRCMQLNVYCRAAQWPLGASNIGQNFFKIHQKKVKKIMFMEPNSFDRSTKNNCWFKLVSGDCHCGSLLGVMLRLCADITNTLPVQVETISCLIWWLQDQLLSMGEKMSSCT